MAMRALCPGGGLAHVRRALLMALPNNGWRVRARVDIFINPGDEMNPYSTAASIAQGLVRVLISRRFRYKSKRNWRGGEE